MPEIITQHLVTFIIICAIWTIPWKGLALWKAARRGDRGWFVIILLVNTLAIFEILYIFFFSEKKGELRKQF